MRGMNKRTKFPLFRLRSVCAFLVAACIAALSFGYGFHAHAHKHGSAQMERCAWCVWLTNAKDAPPDAPTAPPPVEIASPLPQDQNPIHSFDVSFWRLGRSPPVQA